MKSLVTNILILFVLSIQGQNCLPGTTTFTTQTQVNNLAVSNPSCTCIEGSIVISSSAIDPIFNLNGFSNIEKVSGFLAIQSNRLQNLNGLISLEEVQGDLIIGSNSMQNFFLNSIAGLNNLTRVGGLFRLNNNPQLTTLNGLQNLSYVRSLWISRGNINDFSALSNLDSIQAGLTIDQQPNLTNLSFLNGVKGLTTISILNNVNLVNLVGLEGISDLTFGFDIQGNSSLQNLVGLDNLQELGLSGFIFNNSQLKNLEGLNNLTSVGPNFLLIRQNNQLQSLQGLESLTAIDGSLIIDNNSSLTSINALQNLDANTLDSKLMAFQDLEITNNVNLSSCAIEFICDALESATITENIDGNAEGCSSEQQVESSCALLPVVYSQEITTREEDGIVTIEFETSQEINSKEFRIQHSTDLKEFQTFKTLEAQGSIHKGHSYATTHFEPESGINYYRIQQVDLDGFISISITSSIASNSTDELILYPNPAREFLNLDLNDQASFKIFNSNGELILSGKCKKHLDVNNLNPDIYFILVNDVRLGVFEKI